MRILELTNFTAGGCGVWHRVKKESEELSKKGHEILILSSNIVKGTNQIAPETETHNKILIKRFPAKKLGGESFIDWSERNYNQIIKESLSFKPNIIIAHSYRHKHTETAIKIAKQTNAKVFLVTHAPFARDRKFPANLAVWFYDTFKGPKLLKQFTKIIAISKWEIPYLKELEVPENKISYIPNGLQNEFFIKTKNKKNNNIVFTGRIAPIKSIETIIQTLSKIKDKPKVTILGPSERTYILYLKTLISNLNLDNINIIDKVYDKKEQIKYLDNNSIFILPSKSEGMPQSLIEAMSRGCICIASNIPANRDIIIQKVNGLLFEKENPESLARAITYTLNLTEKQKQEIRKNAIKKAKEYDWKILIKTLEKTIND